jgi:hypothetical protein
MMTSRVEDLEARLRLPVRTGNNCHHAAVAPAEQPRTEASAGGAQESTRSSAARSVGSPCAGSTSSTGASNQHTTVISPGLLGSGYFRDIANVLAGDGPSDVKKIGEVMLRHGLTPAPSG